MCGMSAIGYGGLPLPILLALLAVETTSTAVSKAGSGKIHISLEQFHHIFCAAGLNHQSSAFCGNGKNRFLFYKTINF